MYEIINDAFCDGYNDALYDDYNHIKRKYKVNEKEILSQVYDYYYKMSYTLISKLLT